MKKSPDPIDIHVGSRVRLRRNMLGLSQEKLGDAIGLTFQQVQKYERGTNRIGASRLAELSQVLQVPITFFYDSADPVHAPPISEQPASDDPLADPQNIALIESFYTIEDGTIREKLRALAKHLARPHE